MFSNCDREPVYRPGAIQSFGSLLALPPGLSPTLAPSSGQSLGARGQHDGGHGFGKYVAIAGGQIAMASRNAIAEQLLQENHYHLAVLDIDLKGEPSLPVADLLPATKYSFSVYHSIWLQIYAAGASV